MDTSMKRRQFLGASALGSVCLASMMQSSGLNAAMAALPVSPGRSKVRVGKVYLGNPYPGWPSPTVDLEAEVRTFEEEFAKLEPALSDVEFVGENLVYSPDQVASVKEKLEGVDGILVVHLTLGIGESVKKLLELGVPVMVFSPLYAGHEWHIIAPLQRAGYKIDVLPSGDYADLATCIRPFRAIHRLQEAKVLYLQGGECDPHYVEAIRNKFGTEIKTIYIEALESAYKAVPDDAAKTEGEWWLKNAEKTVEPKPEEVVEAARMYLAMKQLLQDEKADAITINCLGMGLIQRKMAYPCIGFSKLSGEGLGGVCEADIKSTMTHLLFMYLTGKPGFISDPVVDLSNNTIIHAHCVSPIKMDGIDGEQCPYIIRNHHEDGRSVSLQVKMRIGEPITMARLIGSDILLYSMGEIVENPTMDRGCKTKIRTKVKDAQKILGNYSCGLHRVIFYGEHSADVKRFCRFKDIRLAREDEEDLFDLPGLEWETYIHP